MTGREGDPRSGQSRVLDAARVAVLLALTVLAGLVVAALAPLAAGHSSNVVTSGSMAPRVSPGDVVVTRPVSPAELRTGQVVLVHDPEVPGGLLLHRLVSFDAEGLLVTRGDANQSDDSRHADPAAVRGVAVLRVPWVGLPALWREQGRYGAIGLTAGVVVAAAVFASTGGRRRPVVVDHDDEPEQFDVDPDAPTVWDMTPVRDAVSLVEATSVRRLPSVPPTRRTTGLPAARELPRVPAARPRRHERTGVVAALPIPSAYSSSTALRLSKTEAVRPAAVRSSARPAVTTTGGEVNGAPSTRCPLPLVPPALSGPRDGRGAAAGAAVLRVRAAGDHSRCVGGGVFCDQPRR